jgi:hypothetical protein
MAGRHCNAIRQDDWWCDMAYRFCNKIHSKTLLRYSDKIWQEHIPMRYDRTLLRWHIPGIYGRMLCIIAMRYGRTPLRCDMTGQYSESYCDEILHDDVVIKYGKTILLTMRYGRRSGYAISWILQYHPKMSHQKDNKSMSSIRHRKCMIPMWCPNISRCMRGIQR